MGHVRVHETASTLSHPSKCHDCGYNGENRFFYVDTGINTEWDGYIIICSSCLLNIIVKTYGFNPFELVEGLRASKATLIEEIKSDLDELMQVRQGLAILGLTTTSLIRLAGFLKEENDGRDLGTVEFHSEQLEQIKRGVDSVKAVSINESSDPESDGNNVETSGVDSEPDTSFISGFRFA